MKTINFQFITDDRFCTNIKAEIRKLDDELKRKTKKAKLDLVFGPPCLLDFGDVKQYRINYSIPKVKWYTCNDIYQLVNSIQTVPYKVR